MVSKKKKKNFFFTFLYWEMGKRVAIFDWESLEKGRKSPVIKVICWHFNIYQQDKYNI